MKKYLLGSLAVFVTFFVLDMLIHGVILQGMYKASASLWRPDAELQGMLGLAILTTIVLALTFTAIYAYFVRGNSVSTGMKYGLLYGIGAGFAWGMGTYAMMPFPLGLACAWFIAFTVESAVAGAVAGWLVKPSSSSAY